MVVGFIAVKQLQMKVAAGLIGESPEKLPGQTEPEGAG